MLTKDAAYRHVAALSNQAKHSAIVKPLVNEDTTGQRPERHDVRFDAFVRKGVTYSQAKIDDVLGPAYDLASTTLVEVGKGLTAALKQV